MGCRHRFYSDLIPNATGIQFLFIGTFNPEWDAENKNNAAFFYGRETNLFWCILPHAFNENCLIDKGREEWSQFCGNPDHVIGLTDIVKEVVNAEYAVHHSTLTKGFNDDELDKESDGNYIFELDFNTGDIVNLVNENKATLRGVFLTRSTHGGIARIWSQWLKIKAHCQAVSEQGFRIVCKELPTPSSRGRNAGIRKKIYIYKEAISSSRR